MTECPNLTIGWHDIAASVYHADPAAAPSLSSSIAKKLIVCPLKAYLAHPRLCRVPTEDSSVAMDFGSLAHKIVLGKGADVEVLEADDWKKKDSQAFRDAARERGHIPALTKNFAEATQLQAGFMRELARLGVAEDFIASKKEMTSIWRSDQSYLRCMIDAVLVDVGAGTVNVFDVKTTGDASPDACVRRIGDGDYDLQAVFQMEAVAAQHPDLRGRMKHLYLFVETDFPYLVSPIELSEEFIAIGRSKFNRALHNWTECLATGRWPGYTTGIYTAEPKPWDTQRELGAAL